MTLKLVGLFALTVVLIVVSPFGRAAVPGTGCLEGEVTIVASKGASLAEDMSSGPQKHSYADCPVVVRNRVDGAEIAQIQLDKQGKFRIDLPAGDYVLDLKKQQHRGLRVAARPFKVVAGQTVRVDLEIPENLEVQ